MRPRAASFAPLAGVRRSPATEDSAASGIYLGRRPTSSTVRDNREDLALVARMGAGDESAFDAFGERYVGPVYRFTLSRLGGDRELARELSQRALCKALARLETFRGGASLLTWLCSCARNEILMHWRGGRTAPLQPSGEELFETTPAVNGYLPQDPEEGLLRRESAELVHLSLDALPAHYARALEWKYLEHMPVKEIAARLRLLPKAAESLLVRARQAFRQAYEGLQQGAVDPTAVEDATHD